MLTAAFIGLTGLGIIALGVLWPVMFPRQLKLLDDRIGQVSLEQVQAERTYLFAAGLPPGQYQTRDQLAKAIVPPQPSFTVPEHILEQSATQPGGPPTLSPEGCIIGTQMGFFARDTRGNFKRHEARPLYRKVFITVFPPVQPAASMPTPATASSRASPSSMHSHTGVFDVDQANVYAPFEIVQQLTGLAPDPKIVAQGGEDFPKRCQQILIKLKNSSAYTDIRETRAKIARFVEKSGRLRKRYPSQTHGRWLPRRPDLG